MKTLKELRALRIALRSAAYGHTPGKVFANIDSDIWVPIAAARLRLGFIEGCSLASGAWYPILTWEVRS